MAIVYTADVRTCQPHGQRAKILSTNYFLQRCIFDHKISRLMVLNLRKMFMLKFLWWTVYFMISPAFPKLKSGPLFL